MSEVIEKKVIDKYPYPATSPLGVSDLRNLQWGYLIFYSDGSCCFDLENKPTKAEILKKMADIDNSSQEE